MDTSSSERFPKDPRVLEAQKEVERLLKNPSSGQPPWGENLKVLVAWAMEYVVQEDQARKDEPSKPKDEPNEGGGEKKVEGKAKGGFLKRLFSLISKTKSLPKASPAQHNSRQENEVQQEQQLESRSPEQSVPGLFLPPHLQDFWNRNPKWVTDYFVNALRYPRLEIIVRAMMQEHLAGQKSYLTTTTAHVNPQSHTGEVTSPAEKEGDEESAGEVAKTSGETSGELSGEAAGEKPEAKGKEKAVDDQAAGEPSEAKDNELSDAAKRLLFQSLQDVLKQHILLKDFLDTFWTMLHEYSMIEDANHMLYLERLQIGGSTTSAPQNQPSSSRSQAQPQQNANGDEEIALKEQTAELRKVYSLCPKSGLRELAECEKIFYDKIDSPNEFDEKMRDRADELITKENELLGINMRNFLERLKLQAQEMVLEQREKEISEREKVLREREEMGL